MNTYNPNGFYRGSRPYAGDALHRAEYKRPAPVRTLTSQSLFQGEHEISIDHAGSRVPP